MNLTANPDIFKFTTFCSRLRLPSTPIWWIWQRIQVNLNPMTQKNHTSLLPNNKPIHGGTSAGLVSLSRMLWRHFIAEEPWVLEWIQIPLDACGQVNSIWIRYMKMGKFLDPERKSRRFKNIRIRVDGALDSRRAIWAAVLRFTFQPIFIVHLDSICA